MDKFKNTLEFARELDKKDCLKNFRKRFYINEGQIFMDGNSLGLCSIDAEKHVLKMIKIWKEETINIWNVEEGKYFNFSEHLANKMAFLINSDPEEITVVGSTTSNIHQMISTFYKPTKERYKILVDDLNFPSDRYAVDSQIKLKGLKVEDALKVVKSRDGVLINEDDIIEAMTEDVALILLPSVLYRSAQLLDMKRITSEAKKRGIYVGWDLCHSIGVIPHDFKDIDPDFAVWCSYKYLAAGLGWFGNIDETQFLLNHTFEQDKTAKGWQIGTPAYYPWLQ